MPYRIVLTRSAIKELGGLPVRTHDRIVDLRELEEDPEFSAQKN